MDPEESQKDTDPESAKNVQPLSIPPLNLSDFTNHLSEMGNENTKAENSTVIQNPYVLGASTVQQRTPRPNSLFDTVKDIEVEETKVQMNYWSFDTDLDVDDLQNYLKRSDDLKLLNPVVETVEEIKENEEFPSLKEFFGVPNDRKEQKQSEHKRSYADVVRQNSNEEVS